jgi:hypothetical protein
MAKRICNGWFFGAKKDKIIVFGPFFRTSVHHFLIEPMDSFSYSVSIFFASNVQYVVLRK